jgi:hypothetical protein
MIDEIMAGSCLTATGRREAQTARALCSFEPTWLFRSEPSIDRLGVGWGEGCHDKEFTTTAIEVINRGKVGSIQFEDAAYSYFGEPRSYQEPTVPGPHLPATALEMIVHVRCDLTSCLQLQPQEANRQEGAMTIEVP